MEGQRDTASRTQTEKDKKDFLVKRRAELADLKELLADERFKRFALRMLDVTHPMRLSFHLQSNQQNFNEGERNVGNWLMAEFASADRNAFNLLMSEIIKGE